MSESSNLCLSCGLCCDGTLIGFVQLESEELPRVRKVMDIEEVNGNGFFLHPCKKFCDGCTIYSERPKQCASFKCGLLNSVEQKELDFDAALEMIEGVKQKKMSIEKKIALLKLEQQSQSFYFRMVELKKVLLKIKAESTLTQLHLELMNEIEQLDSLLSKQFDLSLD